MDIYIAIDNKEKEKFITKAEDIKQELEKINNPVRYIDNVVDLQDTRKGFCIAFTNDLEYIKKLYNDKKLEIICITNRLEGKYILDILEYVKDIYFMSIGLREIVMRIQGFINTHNNRKKCIRGELSNV
ncbi:MAG: hypothetical protein IKL68_01370 [Clostridia bacterium]|nr:hypothetical protein [Clostridia bacterium]